jgi:hypothetical protein
MQTGIHFRVHKSLPLASILSKIKPLHSFKLHYKPTCCLRLRFPSCLLPITFCQHFSYVLCMLEAEVPPHSQSTGKKTNGCWLDCGSILGKSSDFFSAPPHPNRLSDTPRLLCHESRGLLFQLQSDTSVQPTTLGSAKIAKEWRSNFPPQMSSKRGVSAHRRL